MLAFQWLDRCIHFFRPVLKSAYGVTPGEHVIEHNHLLGERCEHQ